MTANVEKLFDDFVFTSQFGINNGNGANDKKDEKSKSDSDSQDQVFQSLSCLMMSAMKLRRYGTSFLKLSETAEALDQESGTNLVDDSYDTQKKAFVRTILSLV